MMKPTTVDDFVKQKVLPEYRPVVALIRRIVREAAPQAQEYIAYGIPVWKIHKIFAVISPNKKGITLSFTHGREFEDKYNLLRGVGKVSRVVRMADIRDVNKAALRYYIRQALKFDRLKE
jgi:hypothetical protein